MTNEVKTDEQLQRDVLAELKWDARVLPNEIGVSVKHDVVTLTGHVDSFYKKWAADEAARRVRGIAAVANDLEIKLPSSEADTLLGSKTLQVTVSNGWVTVRGEVEWNFQKEDAERLLHRLRGVKGVTNLITIEARPTPDEIKGHIEKALVRTAELDAQRISVQVQGSKAILKGKVRSWAGREQAERTAWVGPGITQVGDHIPVSYL